MNRIFLVGNVTRDPEYNQTQNGTSVCKFGLAVSRRFSQDEADYFNIVTWRATADNCQKYIEKGNKVAVAGSIQIREYETQNGSKKTAVDVVADEVQFLTPKAKPDHKPDIEKKRAITTPDDEKLPF